MDSDVPDSRRVIDYGTKYWFVSLVPNEDGLYWLPKSWGALMRLQKNKETQVCVSKLNMSFCINKAQRNGRFLPESRACNQCSLNPSVFCTPLCIDQLFNGAFRWKLSSCDLMPETFVKQQTWLWTEDSFGNYGSRNILQKWKCVRQRMR